MTLEPADSSPGQAVAALASVLSRRSRVLVSHASADAELVDVFVDTLLRNGCNLDPEDIFYTSGEDTGIPSGEDLIATVRAEVGEGRSCRDDDPAPRRLRHP